jgi:hypothetical protein
MRQCTENMLTSLTYKIADAVLMRMVGAFQSLEPSVDAADGQVRGFEYELNLIQGKKGKLL